MATKQAQITSEKIRRSFLKMDSMQTSTNTAKKMASAVGTVITKATWSSTFWKNKKGTNKKNQQVVVIYESGEEIINELSYLHWDTEVRERSFQSNKTIAL